MGMAVGAPAAEALPLAMFVPGPRDAATQFALPWLVAATYVSNSVTPLV